MASTKTWSQNTISGGNNQFGDRYYQNPDPQLQVSFFRTSSYRTAKDSNPPRALGTFDWFFELEEFCRWRERIDSSNILWFTANPGCGKSVLARALVDENLVHAKSGQALYFFFKAAGENNSAAASVCALLHQIFSCNEELFHRYALSSIRVNGDNLKTDFDELWTLLIQVLQDVKLKGTVLILDALDECEVGDRAKLLDKIKGLYPKAERHYFKFLVTSRPYLDFEEQFKDACDSFRMLRIAGENRSEEISADITKVVVGTVQSVVKLKGLDTKVQDFLIQKICNSQQLTYLWFKLVWPLVENALLLPKESEILALLRQIPESLSETYELLLQRSPRKDLATKIIGILLEAHSPLLLDDWNVVLNMDKDCPSLRALHENLLDHQRLKSVIRESCGLLVTIVDSQVYPIHETLLDYFAKKLKPAQPEAEGHSPVSNGILAKLTMSYLLLPELTVTEGSEGTHVSPTPLCNLYRFSLYRMLDVLESVHNVPFLYYACNSWVKLYESAAVADDVREDSALNDLCIRLLRVNIWACPVWLYYHIGLPPYRELHSLVEDMEKTNVDSSSTAIASQSPPVLTWLRLVGLINSAWPPLLKKIWDVDKQSHNTSSFYLQSELIHAAKYYKWRVLEFLIEKGVDVNCQDQEGRSVLWYTLTGLLKDREFYRELYIDDAEVGWWHKQNFDQITKSCDDSEENDTPSPFLTQEPALKLVEIMIEKGANYNPAIKIDEDIREAIKCDDFAVLELYYDVLNSNPAIREDFHTHLRYSLEQGISFDKDSIWMFTNPFSPDDENDFMLCAYHVRDPAIFFCSALWGLQNDVHPEYLTECFEACRETRDLWTLKRFLKMVEPEMLTRSTCSHKAVISAVTTILSACGDLPSALSALYELESMNGLTSTIITAFLQDVFKVSDDEQRVAEDSDEVDEAQLGRQYIGDVATTSVLIDAILRASIFTDIFEKVLHAVARRSDDLLSQFVRHLGPAASLVYKDTNGIQRPTAFVWDASKLGNPLKGLQETQYRLDLPSKETYLDKLASIWSQLSGATENPETLGEHLSGRLMTGIL